MGCARRPPASGVSPGFVLFAPLLSTETYLVDRKGRVVHTWKSDFAPGVSVQLLANGHLLRCGRQPDAGHFSAPGEGGRIQELTWEGEVAWDLVVASAERRQHHDATFLPSGNVLLIAWERKTFEESIEAGRRPDLVGRAGLWPDHLLEIRPVRPIGGEVVWEWHLWDHLVQDRDPRRRNFGQVGKHPELVDINAGRGPTSFGDELVERLRSLGYFGGSGRAADLVADFSHANAVSYNADLDQIVLTVNAFNEIWVIDHGTTTEEAAGHTGGRSGHGGDLLYRWGNPGVHGRGARGDQRLFGPHDARFIPPGLPGAGHLLVFDNGAGRPGGDYSSVLEIKTPVDSRGRYRSGENGRFGPEEPVWEYTAPDRRSFFAEFLSSAQRLPDGNTLICAGPQGRFFEVGANGRTVWDYENPYSGDAPNPHGDPSRSVFRATFVPADHPALEGRALGH